MESDTLNSVYCKYTILLTLCIEFNDTFYINKPGLLDFGDVDTAKIVQRLDNGNFLPYRKYDSALRAYERSWQLQLGAPKFVTQLYTNYIIFPLFPRH